MKLSSQIKEKLKSSSQAIPFEYPGGTVDIEIDAGKISGMDLDRECILERSRLVSAAPARMPYIGFFGKYNKRWYVDIVALPHNSIRTFIAEVFGLLTAVHTLALDMSEADFQKLFFFLREFQTYTRTILAAEEKILYPEVDGSLKKRKGYESHILHPMNRTERKQRIDVLLSTLSDPAVKEQPSVTLASTLHVTMDELSRQILDYFSAKESELPRLFAKAMRGSKEKNRMESRLIKYFGERKQEHYYTALLTLPLHSEEVRTDFEDRHFSKSGRSHFKNAARNVQEALIAVPRAFTDAARSYEARFSMATFLEHYGKDRDADATTKVI